MSAWVKCSEGHTYLSYDLPDDDMFLGAPACPYCRTEWYRKRLSGLRRFVVKSGDTLVFEVEGNIPEQEEARILAFVASTFPGCKGVVLQHGMRLTVLTQDND